MRARVLAKERFENQCQYRNDLKMKHKKNREFQSNSRTFSACNFQLEIFYFHYPNNHNSKNSFYVLLRKFKVLPRLFVLFYNSRCKQHLKLSSCSWLYMSARSKAFLRAWNWKKSLAPKFSGKKLNFSWNYMNLLLSAHACPNVRQNVKLWKAAWF